MPAAYILTTWIWLPLPRPEVFSFFANAGNLEQIALPLLSFRVLTRFPVNMRIGALIDYRIGLRGIPMTWRTEITAWFRHTALQNALGVPGRALVGPVSVAPARNP